jgi:nucleotide-binding universal stress UspA family protein
MAAPMTIVCGTDFSEHSRKAVHAAARLAERMKVPLHLVHATDVGAEELARDSARDGVTRADARLLLEKERLSTLDVDVQVHAREGAPDDVLLNVAAKVEAKLIVVAALGQRLPGRWQLGSHADRLAQLSHVPVLIVRHGQGFEDWVEGRRALRVLIGVDFSLASEHALRWVASLSAYGPCEISATHLYWPPEEFERLGLSGVRDFMGPHPEVARAVHTQLASRITEIVGQKTVRIAVKPHIGRVADRLAKQAEDEEADLLVVGSHTREPLERMIEGSVSGGVLYCARVSVACIPAPREATPPRQRSFRNVLVATDFTPTGDAAVAQAYALVAPQGAVHVVHVAPEHAHGSTEPRDIFLTEEAVRTTEPYAAARRLLEARAPVAYSAHAVTYLHVLAADSPALAIAQAAERLDSDLICLGTHGRTGLAKVALGSVAQAVLHHTHRPVLFARTPKP